MIYDFDVESVISVEAAPGTDPDTLIPEAEKKLVERVKAGDISLRFETVFDAQTGEYDHDWQKKGTI